MIFKTTKDFFYDVAEGKMSQLDINNFIEKITYNHNVEKLNVLQKDIENYIYLYKNDLNKNTTLEQLNDFFKQIDEFEYSKEDFIKISKYKHSIKNVIENKSNKFLQFKRKYLDSLSDYLLTDRPTKEKLKKLSQRPQETIYDEVTKSRNKPVTGIFHEIFTFYIARKTNEIEKLKTHLIDLKNNPTNTTPKTKNRTQLSKNSYVLNNNTKGFLEMVHSGDLAKVDIEIYIKSITQNYDIGLLETLIDDINLFIKKVGYEFDSSFSIDRIKKEIKTLKREGKQVPYRYHLLNEFNREKEHELYEYTKNKIETDPIVNIRELFAFEYELFTMHIMHLKEKVIKTLGNLGELTNKLDIALREMFPNAIEKQLKLLEGNLNGESKYLSLTFVGNKTSLWHQLGKVYTCDIDRPEILRVFSNCVKWKKNNVAEAKPLKYDEINKKLQGKGGR